MTKYGFASTLLRRRTELGLYQKDIAEKAGISVRYLQKLELGTSDPTLGVAIALSVILDFSLDSLKELSRVPVRKVRLSRVRKEK